MDKSMRKLVGRVRAALDKYDMVAKEDTIAIGVSGGKDSMFLLYALSEISKYHPAAFHVAAVTIDPCFNGIPGDYKGVAEFCAERGISYFLHRTDLAHVVFEKMQAKSPCSICAKMRRGILHNVCIEQGIRRLALGHHLEDAVQTFLMNLFYGGKIACFSPCTYLSRKQIHVIRPLIFCEERDIENASRRLHLPIVKSNCPVDGITARKSIANELSVLEESFPDIKAKVIGAMQRMDLDRWGVPEKLNEQ